MKTKEPFTLMVKPVGSACNMACKYCYYLDNLSSNHRMMDESTLEKMIIKFFNDSPGPIVSFIWHGGEPTLRGINFFEKVVELQKKHLPKGYKCWNNLQTNGLNLNEVWARFLKKENFDVGISIDGTKTIHDEYRKSQNGENTYDKIKNNISLLKKYGINVDLLCTVNASSTKNAYQVYQNLKNLNTGWIQFIPIVNKKEDGSTDENSVDPSEYGRFLKTIFHQWFYNDLDKLGIQLFMEIMNYYSGGPISLCWLQEECGMVPVVESDGKVYSCDHFVNKEHLIGDINKDEFNTIMQSDRQKSFGRHKSNLNEKCLVCEYKKICNGGCPKDRDEKGNNYLCIGLYEAFKESEEPIKKAIDLINKKIPIKQVMETLKEERKIKWANISGNSECPCGSGRKYKHCCM